MVVLPQVVQMLLSQLDGNNGLAGSAGPGGGLGAGLGGAGGLSALGLRLGDNGGGGAGGGGGLGTLGMQLVGGGNGTGGGGSTSVTAALASALSSLNGMVSNGVVAVQGLALGRRGRAPYSASCCALSQCTPHIATVVWSGMGVALMLLRLDVPTERPERRL